MTLTEDQCLGGFHQQGEPAEGGKREENEVRVFLSSAPSQVSITDCVSMEDDRLTLHDVLCQEH